MKKILLSILALALFSCSEKVDINKMEQMNGYWQIAKAETKDGEKKEYPINENYEYFEIKDKTGFHKKVRWQPMGKFLVDDLKEKMVASEKGGDVYLNFSSEFGKHIEKVKSISEKELVLEAEDESVFYYNKVNINETKSYGKKAE